MNVILVCMILLVSTTMSAHIQDMFAYRNCDDLHCVDPIWIRGPCSLACPQGQTCRHPYTGRVLKAGITHDIDGQKWRCKPTIFPDWHIAYNLDVFGQ